MSETDDLAAIRQLRAAYFAAYDSGQVEEIVACVSDETVLHTPTGSVAGRTAIAAHYGRVLGSMRATFHDALDEIEIGGALAFTRGRYRLRLEPRSGDGAVVERAGRYLVILKRSLDTPFGWAIHREVVQPMALEDGPSP